MSRLRTHLSYANVMATIAVFVALGGTSYAVTQLPRNSVGPSQIKTNAVRSPEVENGSLRLGDVGASTREALRGQRGDAGPPGAPAAKFFAAVTAAGATPRG